MDSSIIFLNLTITKQCMEKTQKKRIFPILLIIIITTLAYINSFGNDFVYDDHVHILNNKDIKHIYNIPKFFTSPFKDLYRPLRSIHYMVIYSLWGENPLGYHLNSLLFHIINTILAYLIINLLINKRDISLIASLLFAVHPIHTGRVTNITAGFDQLGIFLIFLSFYLYLLYSKKGKIIYFILSISSFLLALLSSEEAIVLPFLLLLYEICFNKENLRKKLKVYIPFFIVGFLYIILRFLILGIGTRASEYIAGNFYSTMLTMTKVFVKYIQLSLFPFRLTLYQHITIANSLFDIKVILSILILLSLILIAIKPYKNNRIITFIIGWFFITLAPFSNILPLKILIAERYLYISSLAFCLLLSILIHKLYNLNKNTKIIAILIFIILLISYSAITIKRNTDWKDDLTLWTRTVKLSPLSSEAHDNLGFAYERKGLIDKAIAEFKKSVELSPLNYRAYTNLGTAYGQKENFTLAETYLKIAIKINPNYYKAYNYLALIYAKQELFNKSILEFKKAIKTNPDFDEAYYNLGIVYEHVGEYDPAKKEFEKAFKLNPKDPAYSKKLKTINY